MQNGEVVRAAVSDEAARKPAEAEESEEYDDIAPTVYDYLQTPQGHEIAKRAVELLEQLVKSKVTQDATNLRFDKWLQVIIVVAVVLASAVLAALDKFSPTVGVLLGALVGYVFGKRTR